MSRINPNPMLLGVVLVGLSASGCAPKPAADTAASSMSSTASVQQLTFATPEDAATALHNAAATEDFAYLRQIFGPELPELGSGDEIEDRQELRAFASAMSYRRDIVRNADGTATIVLGRNDIDFPVRLIQVDGGEANGRWMFDSLDGVERMKDLRVGFGELRTIAFLRALPAAQAEYIAVDWNGDGVRTYASKLRSGDGSFDGLWWPPGPGVPTPPLGPFAAQGDVSTQASPTRGYNGYFFRLLTAQGPGAPGGARSFVRDGRLVDGWAVVAFPSTYDETGVMTFIMGPEGTVYEKDLGPDTGTLVESITVYDPAGWTPAQP